MKKERIIINIRKKLKLDAKSSIDPELNTLACDEYLLIPAEGLQILSRIIARVENEKKQMEG